MAHRGAEQRRFPVAVIRPYGPSTARDVDARSATSVELFGEALDSIRHPGTIDDLHYALLRKKYEKIKVDLVMLRGRGSIDFVRRYGEELWPNVPVVFYNERLEVSRQGLPNSTGVWSTRASRSIWHCACTCTQHLRRWRDCCVRSTWKRRMQPLLSRLKIFTPSRGSTIFPCPGFSRRSLSYRRIRSCCTPRSLSTQKAKRGPIHGGRPVAAASAAPVYLPTERI